MASPRHRLGAHDGGAPARREALQAGDRFPELVLLHVVGITAKGNVAPGGIDRVRFGLAQSAKLRHVAIPDAARRQSPLERLLSEVGHASRGGQGPDIDEQLDPMMMQEFHKLFERSGRMPDRQNYGVRWEGSIAGTRMRFT